MGPGAGGVYRAVGEVDAPSAEVRIINEPNQYRAQFRQTYGRNAPHDIFLDGPVSVPQMVANVGDSTPGNVRMGLLHRLW